MLPQILPHHILSIPNCFVVKIHKILFRQVASLKCVVFLEKLIDPIIIMMHYKIIGANRCEDCTLLTTHFAIGGVATEKKVQHFLEPRGNLIIFQQWHLRYLRWIPSININTS